MVGGAADEMEGHCLCKAMANEKPAIPPPETMIFLPERKCVFGAVVVVVAMVVSGWSVLGFCFGCANSNKQARCGTQMEINRCRIPVQCYNIMAQLSLPFNSVGLSARREVGEVVGALLPGGPRWT